MQAGNPFVTQPLTQARLSLPRGGWSVSRAATSLPRGGWSQRQLPRGGWQ